MMVQTQIHRSFRGQTHGNAVPILKKPPQRIGTALPLSKVSRNEWEA